jgi:hypothetical protein
MQRWIGLGIVVVLPFAAAGCGEKDESAASSTTTTSLTKPEFVRDANKICKAEGDKVERASKQFFADTPPDKEAPPAEIDRFGEKTVYPAIQSTIDRITALGAPAGDEDEVDQFLAALQAGLDKLKQDPQQLAQGGSAPAFEDADKLASDYGLDDCAGR